MNDHIVFEKQAAQARMLAGTDTAGRCAGHDPGRLVQPLRRGGICAGALRVSTVRKGDGICR